MQHISPHCPLGLHILQAVGISCFCIAVTKRLTKEVREETIILVHHFRGVSVYSGGWALDSLSLLCLEQRKKSPPKATELETETTCRS